MLKFSLNRRIAHFLFLWATGIFALLGGETSAQSAREYEIKAVFLYNFVQFVEWPPTAFENASSPIRIGILGANPLAKALEEAVRNETVRNRKVVVQRARQVDDLKNCHLVFVGRAEKARIADVISLPSAVPALTVSEVDDFLKLGGIVNFYQEGNKVRFELNPEPALRKQLKISSELLALGRKVGSEPPKEEK